MSVCEYTAARCPVAQSVILSRELLSFSELRTVRGGAHDAVGVSGHVAFLNLQTVRSHQQQICLDLLRRLGNCHDDSRAQGLSCVSKHHSKLVKHSEPPANHAQKARLRASIVVVKPPQGVHEHDVRKM